ncbi:MAG: PKD domain-containing protein [Bacteroidetes bacterium]|nr:MAG: PKD domain-containing protein [Bacteroidota bacterium]
MMRLRVSILLVVSLLSFVFSFSQDKSNKGKEFWLGYGYCWVFDMEAPTNTQELVLYLSAEQPATVTVSVNSTGWSQTVNIPANTVNATIRVPKSGVDDARIFNEGLFNRGVHIVSDTPIVVYAHAYNNMVSGATMLMPVETYGYKYYSLNYSQSTSGSSPPNPPITTTQNGPAWYSWFYVIASEDNTKLEITPSDTTRNGWLPGQTYTVNLNKGQLYNVMGKLGPSNKIVDASKDMSGSKVLSVPGADGNCHPVAVFSGSGGIRLCKNDGGEYMQQQVFPTQAWGTRYLTYHTLNNTTTDINDQFKNFYRIAVSDPTTVVKRNGVVMTGLINNFYYEYLDSLGGDYIEADKPVLMGQYTPGGNRCYLASQFAYGDPEMFYLSPVEQGRSDVLFYATRNANIDFNYLNVIVSNAGLASLRLDGAAFNPANIRPHPNHPGYSVAVARILGAAAQHRLVSDSNFTATMYGLGFFESYGYNVGTNINNLNHYSTIKNTFNTTTNIDSFTCPKSPVRLFVKLGYQATSIHWKLSQVATMTPNADSIINNPVPVTTELINGRTYYIYTLQQDFSFATTGTYFIPVSFTATVIENCSQTEYAQVKVVVKPGPVSNFNFSSPACLKDSVYLTGTAVPGIFTLNNYIWTFDDATTQTTVNAVKKFATAGNHDVRYRVIATNGCVGDTTKTINVFDSPVANFGVTNPICQTDSVFLTDSTLISSGTIASWQWNFGDGNTITRTNNSPFYHHYTAPGPYTISLVVNSNNGCKSDTMRRSINVFISPIAKFGYSGNICVTDSIRFTDTSSVAVGTITSWQWNFGDGNTLIRNNNSAFWHPYTTTGNFVVSLVVFSNNGCKSDTFRRTVSVNNRPSATMTNTGLPCIDSLQRFVSSYTAGASPATWWWDFGDGQNFSSTTSNTASHSYSTGLTNITIRHVVNLGAGCVSDTATFSIPLINPNPVASFTVIADTACVNKPVQFNSSSTGVTVWNWNFGNGTGTNAPPFIRTYSSANTYNISLIVANAAGCRSLPVTNSITINPNPSINAGPDKFLNTGGSTTLDATIANPSSYNFTWTPSTFLSASNILNPTATPDITTDYSILAVDKITNCTDIDNVTVNIITGLYVPSGFTPNRDGKNDVWQIPGLALYPDALVQVFNRYGEIVYQTKDYNSRPWDGKYKGTDQPNGVFVYIIQLNDAEKRMLKGYVTIIR